MIEVFSRKINLKEIESIGLRIGEFADDVDQKGRFPKESIKILKENKLLSCYIPEKLGGRGMGILDLVEIGKVLGQHCASTAMIWAMHQIQIACLVHHGNSKSILSYLERAASKELLIASITSEVGTGGDISRSVAGVELEDNQGYLSKDGSVVSYGNFADSFLTTAKKSKESTETNQVLVLINKEDTKVEQTSEWDTLGMRGTCSPGFSVEAKFPISNILDLPYRQISSQTMVPFSHILWSSVWYGIANDAFNKARKISKMRMKNSLISGKQGYEDTKLVSIHHSLNLLLNNLEKCTGEYHELIKELDLDVDSLESLDFSLQINNLKIISSDLAVDIVQKSLLSCGFAGYQNHTPFSLGRNMRDILSSVIMIHNERLVRTSSSLLLLQK